jgi:hypothetical protein
VQDQIRVTFQPYPSNANFTYLGPDGRANSGDEGAAPFAFTQIANRPGAFGFPPAPALSSTKLFAFYQANPGAFRLDEAGAWTAYVGNARNAEEIISSAFGRGDVSFFQHRLKIVGGVRAEQTNIKAEGPLTDPTLNFQRDANGKVILGANGRPITISNDPIAIARLTNVPLGTHVKKEYLRWFPSINASYNLRENLVARAAWHTSIGRPNFVQYSGSITLPDIEAPPTDLQPDCPQQRRDQAVERAHHDAVARILLCARRHGVGHRSSPRVRELLRHDVAARHTGVSRALRARSDALRQLPRFHAAQHRDDGADGWLRVQLQAGAHLPAAVGSRRAGVCQREHPARDRRIAERVPDQSEPREWRRQSHAPELQPAGRRQPSRTAIREHGVGTRHSGRHEEFPEERGLTSTSPASTCCGGNCGSSRSCAT